VIRELGVGISVRKPNPVVTSVAFALELAAFLLLWLVVVFVATEVAYQLYDVFSGNNPGAQERVSRGIGDAAFIVIFLGCLVIEVLFRASTLLFSAHDTNRAMSSTAPAFLYLRSFSSDESKPLLSQILARWFQSRSFFAPTGVLSAFTVEQVVANSLLGFKHIAVGRPGEPIQLPGASRIYVKGSDWQVVVENLMREAQAVLVHVDSTHPKVRGSGLAWEIEQIVSSGSLEKTVFLTVDGNGTAQPFGAFAEILRAAGIAAAARAGQQQLTFLQHGLWSCVLRDHPLGPLDGLRGALAALSGLHPSFRAREGGSAPRWVRRVVTGTLALMLASPLALWWSDRLVTLTAAKTEVRLQSGQIVDAERASGDKVLKNSALTVENTQ
jgi:hypothetical protein